MNFAALLHSAQGPTHQIRNQIIEFDHSAFTLIDSFSFYDCEFKLVNGVGPSVILYASQLLRFENCIFHASICIWGQRGGAEYEPLEHFGPSVFFDSCRGAQFHCLIPGVSQPLTCHSKVQVSGFVDHVRIHSIENFSFEVDISQIRFTKLELLGSFLSIQLVEYNGKEIFLRQVEMRHLWIRENINTIPYVEIDEFSVLSIADWIRKFGAKNNFLLQTVQMLLDILQRSKQGRSFLVLNHALSYHMARESLKKPFKFWNFILYGLFRNFYSLFPWVFLSVALIFFFTLLYRLNGTNSFVDAFLESIFAFSGNPSNDTAKPLLHNAFSAVEAYLGIFIVILSSAVLSRKYVAHR